MPQSEDITSLPPLGNPRGWCDMVSIPKLLLRHRQVSVNAKLIYSVLLELCGNSHSCAYSQLHIGTHIGGLCRTQLKKYFKELERVGLITARKTLQNSIYSLRLHPLLTDMLYQLPVSDSHTAGKATLKTSMVKGRESDPMTTRHTDFPVPPGASEAKILRAEMMARAAFNRYLMEDTNDQTMLSQKRRN